MSVMVNKLFEDDTPLENRAILDTSNSLTPITRKLISFDHILKTGTAPIFSKVTTAIGYNEGNFHVDWNADDALMKAMGKIELEADKSIKSSPKLQNLLEKQQWSKQDRVDWERGISEIVSREVDKIPGLGRYRLGQGTTGTGNVQRSNNLNDLSKDIENGTNNIEFDCEQMSLLEGALLQRIDASHLPAEAEDYKQSSNYFYVSGENVTSQGQLGYHAFIISSATGNIIEATMDPSISNQSPYAENTDANHSFKDFVNGAPTILQNGAIYSSAKITNETIIQRDVKLKQITNKIYDEVYDKLPDEGNAEHNDLEASSHEAPPPEIQSLIEIKNAMGTGNDFEKYKTMFVEEIQSLAQNGELNNVLNWIQEHPESDLSQNIKIEQSITDNPGPTSTQNTAITLNF